jgi:hypothetical protein
MSVIKRAFVLAAVCAIAMALGGCDASSGDSGSDEDGGSERKTPAEPGTPEAAVESFWDAETKHGTLTFSNVRDDGTVDEQRIEYWFDGDRYRLTWFNDDGSVRLHMISPDGVDVYHCNVEDETSVLAYTRAEFHQWIFNGPPDWRPGDGVSEDGLTKYTFTAQKLWDIEGASQDFYLEDLVVYTDGARIITAVTRTTSHLPESEDDLVVSTYTFDEPELDVDVPNAIFELPYDIVEAGD